VIESERNMERKSMQPASWMDAQEECSWRGVARVTNSAANLMPRNGNPTNKQLKQMQIQKNRGI
jgi:hypothetical protein